MSSWKLNQQGIAPILLMVAVIGILGFVFVANSAPIKNQFLASIFPTNTSFAMSPYNPGDTDGDLDVDIFDYNSLLTNFGKVFTGADFNNNTTIDIFDYNIVLSNFNKKYASNPSSPPIGDPNLALATLNQGLVAYWKLDESSVNGTTGEIKDASGNNTNATAKNGATVSPAKYANGVTLDGVNDYIDGASPTALDNLTAKDFTISLWINPNLPACGTTVAYYPLFNKDGYNSQISCSGASWYRLTYYQTMNPTTSSFQAQTRMKIQNGNWEHLTFKYNSTTKAIIIFQNGKVMTGQTGGSGAGTPKDDASFILKLGEKFPGKIDDIRIYNRALNQSEIAQLASVNPSSIPPSTNIAMAPEPEIPACTDHNSTRWHALVKKNSDGTVNCSYGHEHHDDPNSVNDIFGPPGAWYGQSGQEISYPWQTYSFTTPAGVDLPMPSPPPANAGYLENNAKHNGYKWVVRRDVPCIPFRTGAPSDGCYRAMRVLFHTLGTTADVTVRFHSFSIEALVEQGGKQGIVRTGGWMDTGHLGLLVDGGSSLICPPVVTNPPIFTCPPAGRTDGNARNAYSTNVPSPHTPHANPGGPVNWYIRFRGIAAAQPHVQDFGPVDYADPFNQLYYPEKYQANNSAGGHENVFVNTTFSWLTPFNQNGRINYTGYANRHGTNVTGCTSASLDCVPVKVEGAPPAIFSAHPATDPTAFYDTDHDLVSPVTGKSLIQYPN